MSRVALDQAIQQSREASFCFVVFSEPVATQFRVNFANFEVRNHAKMCCDWKTRRFD